GRQIIYCRVRQCHPREKRHKEDTGNAADKLREDVEQSVPVFDFTQSPKGQRDRWIEVCAGTFTEWREDQCDGCAAHCYPYTHSPHKWVRKESDGGRLRMEKQDGEQPRRNHEEPKFSGFANVLRPMFFQRAQHFCLTRIITAARLRCLA